MFFFCLFVFFTASRYFYLLLTAFSFFFFFLFLSSKISPPCRNAAIHYDPSCGHLDECAKLQVIKGVHIDDQ